MKSLRKLIAAILYTGMTAGCTTTTVDEYRETNSKLNLTGGDKIVVLGRRHASNHETEADFINCVGKKLAADTQIEVIGEQVFVDSVYPWFEPRTAPLGLKRMTRMLNEAMIAEPIHSQHIRYMIWIEGNTETTDREGSVSCAVGPGGGGCFGFATWEKQGAYEAVIWDLANMVENGRVKVNAKGSSYMIAIGVPVPIIAQVQKQACEGIGTQIRSFFSN
jgi:hypothetical protein